MTATLTVSTWTEPAEDGRNRDAVATAVDDDGGRAVIAVADGASNTLFAGEWARTLVEAAVATVPSDLGEAGLRDAVLAASGRFDPTPADGLHDRWAARKWARFGSQATLLVADVRITSPGAAVVDVLAVGDSVLLVVGRAGVTTFPPIDRDGFGRRPALVASLDREAPTFERWQARLEPGDVVLATSDGAAKPLLDLVERDGPGAARAFARAVDARSQDDRGPLELIGTAGPGGAPVLQDDATAAVCTFVPLGARPSRPGVLGRVLAILRGRLGGRARGPRAPT